MDIHFTGADAEFIRSKLESGDYSSEDDLIKDAVRRMREAEEAAQRFYDAVQIGDDQIAQGKTVPFSEQLMKDIEKRAIQKAKNHEPYQGHTSPAGHQTRLF